MDALRKKQLIPAENFDCVTIMFSDLPQFADFCSLSTPFQVTAYLNVIYLTLDSAIDHFDAYKVETISDSYVVWFRGTNGFSFSVDTILHSPWLDDAVFLLSD